MPIVMMNTLLSRSLNGDGAVLLTGLSIATSFFLLQTLALALNNCPSSFHGTRVTYYRSTTTSISNQSIARRTSTLVMRKQKASDRRTARMQRGNVDSGSLFTPPSLATATQILTSTPMTNSEWKHKTVSGVGTSNYDDSNASAAAVADAGGGGRGRARKRLKLYNSLASYHSTFLEHISEEYQMEEAEVITRLEASLADPFLLEKSGHALFDVHPQRRGNLFSDEVYRLEKSLDATTTFFSTAMATTKSSASGPSPLPPNHKFARNDVIVLSLQPRGNGDFLGTASLPTNADAVVVEARVLNLGPTYLDVAIPAGKFATAFGPASNNNGEEGKGDPNMRVRVDRFFSDVPFKRMVAALGQLTAVPQREGVHSSSDSMYDKRMGVFQMDPLLKEAILSTFAIKDEVMLDGMSNPSLGDLPKKLAKPPMATSTQLANQVISYIQVNPIKLFPQHNEPQLTAIRAALTRRLTLIQGPPGTGKTTTAGSIAFGFVHQCRSLSPNCKVLATAFSNVGADNLAETFLSLGLKVVRVGKPSGISESLWNHTLEAAIQRDPNAQKAIEEAAKISAKIKKVSNESISRRTNKGSHSAERAKRDAVTTAVKDSIQACNIAATRALREADIIVATSIGAADAQLLAACGIYPEEEEEMKVSARKAAVDTRPKTPFGIIREFAPDNLPPLSTPFVIIDEACQSVEPATLIPIVSTMSCRSLVLLGDPCQLPPTVKSDSSPTGLSPLSVSLMSRLASILPQPVTVTAQKDTTPLDSRYLHSKATTQAVSKIVNAATSYKKIYSGSLLLSVQYRMHPSIAAFPSAIFYNGLLASPLQLGSSRQFPQHLRAMYPSNDEDHSVRFVHVGGRNNESNEAVASEEDFSFSTSGTDSATSYRNDAEARQIVQILTSLLSKESSFNGSIGIVTPYSGQVSLIKTMMARDQNLRALVQSFPRDIEVKSVDAYQGRERDLIIFSAVRSNRQGRIGFLKDWRRMNVALTRAKNGILVLGDSETLKEGDKHWGAFVRWCEDMGCLVDSSRTQ